MAQEPDLPPPNAGFEVVRRGYDQGQVDTHLRRLDAEIQILATDRDAALDQSAQLARELDDARARAERLRVQVRSLVSPPQSVQGMSERMRSMLRLAEDEAGEMLKPAEQEAAQLRREAEDHVAQVLAAAREEAAALRAASQAEAERSAAGDQPGPRRAGGRDRRRPASSSRPIERPRRSGSRPTASGPSSERATAWTESETRRKVIEEDFTIAMDRRRSEALTQLTAERERLEREVETTRARTAAEARAQLEQARRPPGRSWSGPGPPRRRSPPRPTGSCTSCSSARPNHRATRRHPRHARGIPRRAGAAARGAAGPPRTPRPPTAVAADTADTGPDRGRRPSGARTTPPAAARHRPEPSPVRPPVLDRAGRPHPAPPPASRRSRRRSAAGSRRSTAGASVDEPSCLLISTVSRGGR